MTFLGSRPRRHSFTALSSTENHNGRDRPSSFDGRDDDRDSQNTVVDEGNARDIEEGEPFLEKGIGNQTVRNSTRSGFGWAVFWIVVNTLATIGIVGFLVCLCPCRDRN